ncbi:hypothetical protein Tco_1184352 [Tanacetum coccineum]
MHTVHGDGVAGIKQRRRDVSSDDVRNFTTASRCGRLKEDLESSTWRRHNPLEYNEYVVYDPKQTQEGKVDIIKALDDNLIVIESSGKESEKQVQALDANLVVAESSGTDPEKQDERSKKGNDTDTDDAYIKPTYDEEQMTEVQLIAECNIFAKEQQHAEQPDLINEGTVD